jgi:hypothetical protein
MNENEKAKIKLERIKSAGYKAVGFNTNNLYSQVKGTVPLLKATINRINDAYAIACKLEVARINAIVQIANDDRIALDNEMAMVGL